jgi:hypothetical protein
VLLKNGRSPEPVTPSSPADAGSVSDAISAALP